MSEQKNAYNEPNTGGSYTKDELAELQRQRTEDHNIAKVCREYQQRIAELEAKLEQATNSINRLNEQCRQYGAGQGEIDQIDSLMEKLKKAETSLKLACGGLNNALKQRDEARAACAAMREVIQRTEHCLGAKANLKHGPAQQARTILLSFFSLDSDNPGQPLLDKLERLEELQQLAFNLADSGFHPQHSITKWVNKQREAAEQARKDVNRD